METTLSPLDNRYASKVKPLLKYYSIRAWIVYRIKVELLYYHFLYDTLTDLCVNLDRDKLERFLNVYEYLDELVKDVLNIEKITRHDIKAIEIALRNHYDRLDIGSYKYKEYIHFGLTSQDVNSVAFSMQIKDSINDCMLVRTAEIFNMINDRSMWWINTTIVARTHGQAAVPTSLGKEFGVFIERLNYCLKPLETFKYHTKIGGAVGTLGAHYMTYPKIDWTNRLDEFCERLGFKRWKTTTQITNYEDIIEVTQILIRINNIFIDFCQDIWLYISNDIFTIEKETEDQVGSSTMPQKINPINFENAEGNLKMANAGLNFFVEKLPVSRLQRDLTDTTILRNYGVYLGHILIALSNLETGLNKLQPNYTQITMELSRHPEILGEAIQSLMRKHGIENSYEIMRKIMQGNRYLNLSSFKRRVIKEIEEYISPELKSDIMKLTFDNTLGYLEPVRLNPETTPSILPKILE